MFKPRKVGWSDYGGRGLCEGGGNCLKYLKKEWNSKEGRRGNKDFKNGGRQAGSRGGCLKKRGLEPPYELCVYFTALKIYHRVFLGILIRF